MARIAYTNKIENNGATAQGRLSAAEANEIKTSVNTAYDNIEKLYLSEFSASTTGTLNLLFDKTKVAPITLTGNLTLALAGSGNIPGMQIILKVTGSGFSVLFNSLWTNQNNGIFDIDEINIITLTYIDQDTILYSIVTKIVPDVTPPQIVSIVTTNGSEIVITTNEDMNNSITPATSSFSPSGGLTVSSMIVDGQEIKLSLSGTYAAGDTITLSYTQPGTNALQDGSGNLLPSFSNAAVANNRFPKSLNGAASGILQYNAVPTNLIFGNGATDQPFSVAFWMNTSSLSSGTAIMEVGNVTGQKRVWTLYQNASGKLFFTLWRTDTGGAIERTFDGLSTGWHFIVITYDASKTANGITCYIDNVAVSGTDTSIGNYSGMNTDPAIRLIIRPLLLVDNQAVITGVLTSGERTAMFGSPGARIVDYATVVDPTRIKAYFKYEDNIEDSSSSAYHLAGAPVFSTSQP